MALKKGSSKIVIVKPEEDKLPAKITMPLIFISHDTRDAELAEEFSTLLRNASTGALKSFVSSDKKSTRGMEYGVEWYPAIMDKIDEASEVVCLLTKKSVERPWILYEAGVAKGKLGKKVIGVALGIQPTVAFTGPFAQFQNNDGSVPALTKLVIDLVKKVPGLDPDAQIVEPLVQNFHNRATEILVKSQETSEQSKEEADENTVAKLFEEVKIMFESLPSRIEHRLDHDSKRRRRKFHPMLVEEIMHMGMRFENPQFGFLMLTSLIKEDLPWLYEISVETFRELNKNISLAKKQELMNNLGRAFEMVDHPIIREYFGKSNEKYIIHPEVLHYIYKYLDRLVIEVVEEKSKEKNKKKEV